MEENGLPADLWEGTDAGTPDIDWQQIDSAEKGAIAKKLDLVLRTALQYQRLGNRDFIARATQAIGNGQDPNTISTLFRVASLFRMPKEAGGLGWSREELGKHEMSRLRVFGAKQKWAFENPEKVSALLNKVVEEDGKARYLKENELRAQLKEEIQDTGTDSTAPKNNWQSVRVLVPKDFADIFQNILAAGERKWSRDPDFKLPAEKEARTGVLLQHLALDWVLAGFWVPDANGGPDDWELNAQFYEGPALDKYYADDEEEQQQAVVAVSDQTGLFDALTNKMFEDLDAEDNT